MRSILFLLALRCFRFITIRYCVRGMKPAPFDNQYTFEAPSGARLVSTNTDGDGYSTKRTTKVFGSDGGILYEMPIFTGRRKIDLSTEGSVAVLDGNAFLGVSVMMPPKENDDLVVSTVYLNGKLWRSVLYKADLGGKPIDETKIMGGGWARRPFSMDVDWESNAMVYTVDGVAESVEIPLPDVSQATESNE